MSGSAIPLLVYAFTFGVLIGIQIDSWINRRAAVHHGHAEYYLDEKHRKCWRWKPLKASDPTLGADSVGRVPNSPCPSFPPNP